jgi:hypothetical protein
MNEQVLAEIVKRGYGEIDFTAHHGPPDRQKSLFSGMPVMTPPTRFIIRKGVKLDIARCEDCGVPFSFPVDEESDSGPFLCDECSKFRPRRIHDGEDGDAPGDEE